MAHPEVGSETATITLSGDLRAIPAGSTIATLLELLEPDPRLVVVERNSGMPFVTPDLPATPASG